MFIMTLTSHLCHSTTTSQKSLFLNAMFQSNLQPFWNPSGCKLQTQTPWQMGVSLLIFKLPFFSSHQFCSRPFLSSFFFLLKINFSLTLLGFLFPSVYLASQTFWLLILNGTLLTEGFSISCLIFTKQIKIVCCLYQSKIETRKKEGGGGEEAQEGER